MAGIIRKETIRTVIITTQAEFRVKAIQQLNGAAYPAEKLNARDFDELRAMITKDPRVGNIIVDTTGEPGKEVLANGPAFVEALQHNDNLALIYCSQVDLEALRQKPELRSPHILLAPLPQSRDHYAAIFHTRGATKGALKYKTAKPAKPAAPPQPIKAPEPAAKTNLTTSPAVLEAAQHVKNCITQLRSLLQNRNDLALLTEVGQRFNGVFGTFSFFTGSDGFAAMHRHATIIDCVCRTYAAQTNAKTITEAHAAMLHAAAKAYYEILARLLRNEEPLVEQVVESEKLHANFMADDSVVKPAMQSQDDVDALLNELAG